MATKGLRFYGYFSVLSSLGIVVEARKILSSFCYLVFFLLFNVTFARLEYRDVFFFFFFFFFGLDELWNVGKYFARNL